MALQFPSGFSMAHSEPVDNRLTMSKAEMLATKKAKMPQVYLTVCTDDGQLYLYNSDNEVDEETGRFRLFESSNMKQLPPEIVDQLISDDEDNIIEILDDGSIKVAGAESISLTQIESLFQKEENSNGA